VPKKPVPIYVGGTSKPALRRAARFGDGWIGVMHPLNEIEGTIEELNGFRRECGRENEPFDIMLHCPDAQNVDAICRLEDLGVTDLQVSPWTMPDTPAHLGVAAFMQQQPPLAEKQDAIRRYADEVITKFG
jgi:hypothetical protein